jgi:hypothetical protein
MRVLFKNAHFIAKNNKPFTDFAKQCELDRAKGLLQKNDGTYCNNKSALK